jgi:hypothetical protein
MGKSRWAKTDIGMRWMHLYTGLFLTPWLLVYATSALFLNHNQWFREQLKVQPPRWELKQEIDFAPENAFPTAPAEQARAVLQHLHLDGPHRIQGKPNAQQMIIFRICGSGNYRITWRRQAGKIKVEKQSFSLYRLIHFLHFRGGYAQPYLASKIWAVLVDAVSICLWVWIVSGIYIWARRPKKRLWGSICVISGSALFIILVIVLCL